MENSSTAPNKWGSYVKESAYKGKPTISILMGSNDTYPFTLGLKKARLVLDHIDAIRAFVERHGARPSPIGTIGRKA